MNKIIVVPHNTTLLPAQSIAPRLDDSISATIAVAINIADFRISANVAQVMGNTE